MNTQKAIEFCRSEIREYGTIKHSYGKEKFPENKPIITAYKSIIALLKRGEKYEAMWREITSYIMHYNFGNQYVTFREEIRPTIKEIKQKYFPKEIIEEVVEGITEQIKEGAEIAKKEAKTDEDKMD